MVDSASVFVTALALKILAVIYLAPNPYDYDLFTPRTIRPLKDKSQDRWAKKKQPETKTE